MPATSRARFQLFEYGPSTNLVAQISSIAGIEREKARRLLEAAGERVAKTLRFSSNPLQIDASGIRAADFAGMIRLGPSLELEIVPKFLSEDETGSRWREDFYYLANLSRHGRLLASERLRASGQAPKDLASLVGRSLTGMYWDNRRRPLRSYRRTRIEDVFIEGEIDPVDIRFPTPDGFSQQVVRYDRSNRFNAAILKAARELLPEISDSQAASGLIRVIQDLPDQKPSIRRRGRTVPGRSRSWQPVVDLSHDIIDGFGISYKEGYSSAPGYVLSTWQSWEHLLTIAVRLAYGSKITSSQQEYVLGTRKSAASKATTNIQVYPDLTVQQAGSTPQFIIDAKYKTNAQKWGLRITEPDIYEALAFAKAASCDHVVLAYPALPTRTDRPLGTTSLFERLNVGDAEIYGVQVEVRGISKRGGLQIFGGRLKDDIAQILAV